MKLIIETQNERCGDKFLNESTETVDIFKCREKIVIERDDEQIILPIEALSGVLNSYIREDRGGGKR